MIEGKSRHVVMADSVWLRLKAAAALRGKPLNQLLTEIIEDWLNRNEGKSSDSP